MVQWKPCTLTQIKRFSSLNLGQYLRFFLLSAWLNSDSWPLGPGEVCPYACSIDGSISDMCTTLFGVGVPVGEYEVWSECIMCTVWGTPCWLVPIFESEVMCAGSGDRGSMLIIVVAVAPVAVAGEDDTTMWGWSTTYKVLRLAADAAAADVVTWLRFTKLGGDEGECKSAVEVGWGGGTLSFSSLPT